MESKTEQLKVLQVFASLDIGGAESRMMDIYRKIDRREIQFDFVTLEDRKQFFEEEIKQLGGKVYHLSSPRKVGIIKHIKELCQLMKAGEYHTVHAHTSYHCGCVMIAAWLEKIPVRVAHARTTGSIQNGWKTKLYVYVGRILNCLFSTDRVAISRDAGRFVFGNTKFEVIPNAIDLEKYRGLNNSNRYREQFNIAEDAFVVGHVGRFDRFKNQEFIVKWFAQYSKNNSYLVFVGDGKEKQVIEQKANELNIFDKVVFAGVRGDIPAMMSMFDVLLFPSIVEGLGGVVLEAQAAGIPAVVSDAVPKEVDMGLELIEVCSLNDDNAVWDKAIEKSIKKINPSFETISEAFNIRNYSLDYAVNKMTDIYFGTKKHRNN